MLRPFHVLQNPEKQGALTAEASLAGKEALGHEDEPQLRPLETLPWQRRFPFLGSRPAEPGISPISQGSHHLDPRVHLPLGLLPHTFHRRGGHRDRRDVYHPGEFCHPSGWWREKGLPGFVAGREGAAVVSGLDLEASKGQGAAFRESWDF